MSVRRWLGASGEGHGTPVILLHSLFFTGEMFGPVATNLSQRYACLAPTFRGQDGAGRGDYAPTIKQLALDVLYWLDEAGSDKMHLVGSSMGAYVAMEILRQRPDQVKTIVLSCCTADVEQDPARFEKLTEFLAKGPGPKTSGTIAGVMFGEASLDAPNDAVTSWTERFAQTPAAMAEVAECMFAHPAYHDVLVAYDGPALLLAGRQDRAKSPADMARIAASLSQADTHIFETSGHTPAVEVPEQFATRVAMFLDQATSGTTSRERIHAH